MRFGERGQADVARWGMLLASAFIVAAIASGCISGPPKATVNETTYQVIVARSLIVSPDDLTEYGEVHSYTDSGGYPFEGDTAYALDGVSPALAVVVPWAPGLTDDGGALGDWALLESTPTSDIPGICDYFDPGSEATPTNCR